MNYHFIPFNAMGSVCELQCYLDNSLSLERVTSEVFNTIRYYEDTYSRYKPDSITSKINASAGVGPPIRVDQETEKLLNYAMNLHEQSDGLFDITSGSLRNIWNFKSHQTPTEQSIETALHTIGWDKVSWDAPFFRLQKKGMEIDFGGFVKEYTVDKVALLCETLGIHHGVVNLGGDIRVIGPHPDGAPWKVGIQHPRKANTAIATIDMIDGAIASSGDYERYSIIDGVRHCHILNPKTGKSLQPYYSGVSVLSDSCLIAGSFSTIGLLKSEQDKEWITDAGLPYLAIDQGLHISGNVETSLNLD